jgi:hypothetical protein
MATTKKTASAGSASAPMLTLRELNRATLARQMLLARERATPGKVIERLLGMQAQLPRPPFVGLWTRLARFEREDLLAVVHRREVVRATLMRATIHLMTAGDYARLRPALQPALTNGLRSALGARFQKLDIPALVREGRAFFGKEPRTFNQLRALLAERYPDQDESAISAMSYAVRTHLPLVQVPTDARWGWPGNADFTLADTWLGAKPAKTAKTAKTAKPGIYADEATRELVLRYLAAFGPATMRDAQAWSGHPGLAPVFEALRPELAVFRDEKKRELFDLPGAPRPSADAEAPVRFLPEFDNLLLGHADRSRVFGEVTKATIFLSAARAVAPFLVDGMIAGSWRVERTKSTATLTLEPFAKLTKGARGPLIDEAERLVRFVESDATSFEVIV